MPKKKYPPLLENGFRKIAFWQFDELFLEPFREPEHRKYLIDRFKIFLSEFQKLGINAEIWIDGSFTTEKPQPQDIDVVFWLDIQEIANLDENRNIIFSELMLDREVVRSRYGIDVYFADKNSETDKNKWIESYGVDYAGINPKGIFKLDYKHDVDHNENT